MPSHAHKHLTPSFSNRLYVGFVTIMKKQHPTEHRFQALSLVGALNLVGFFTYAAIIGLTLFFVKRVALYLTAAPSRR